MREADPHAIETQLVLLQILKRLEILERQMTDVAQELDDVDRRARPFGDGAKTPTHKRWGIV
jgi:hypothetical protein